MAVSLPQMFKLESARGPAWLTVVLEANKADILKGQIPTDAILRAAGASSPLTPHGALYPRDYGSLEQLSRLCAACSDAREFKRAADEKQKAKEEAERKAEEARKRAAEEWEKGAPARAAAAAANEAARLAQEKRLEQQRIEQEAKKRLAAIADELKIQQRVKEMLASADTMELRVAKRVDEFAGLF